MRLVILAAGRGSRMGEITKDKPKCLLEFGEKTLLEHTIDSFLDADPTGRVAVVVGHKATDVVGITNRHYRHIHMSSPVSKGFLKFYHNKAYRKTGAAYSLMCAKDFWLGHDCIIMEGDILFHPSIMEDLIDCSFPNCIPVDTQGYVDWGEETLAFMHGHMVAGLAWPAKHFRVGEVVVMAKVSAHKTRKLLDQLPLHKEIIAPLNVVGGFHFHPVEVPWVEIDTPSDLFIAKELYRDTGGFA